MSDRNDLQWTEVYRKDNKGDGDSITYKAYIQEGVIYRHEEWNRGRGSTGMVFVPNPS